MDRLTPEQRHRAMSRIKSNNTSIELLLRKELWKKGYRYRKNWSALPGKPDIAITKYKVAIFCDSEFFHGKDWMNLKARLEKGSNPDYWIKKITRNMVRDDSVDMALFNLGWKVIRFWGNEIKSDPERCVAEIESAIIESIVEGSTNPIDIHFQNEMNGDYYEK